MTAPAVVASSRPAGAAYREHREDRRERSEVTDMIDILRSFTLRKTPQSRPADRRQVPNSAGGFTFEVSDEQRLRRFLVLGTDGGTYYTSAPTLTLEAAQFVVQLAEFDPQLLVDTIVDVSLRGAAPRQQPALFALALAASVADDAGRARALAALPQVARTGTHLFLFATYVEQFRGWGRGLRRGVAQWYLDRGVDELALQVVKYRQREGWSHRDLLRLAHPVTVEPDRAALFDWVAGREPAPEVALPRLVEGFRRAQSAAPEAIPGLIGDYGLTWEMLPDEALTRPATWAALLQRGMPQTALLRQLPRLTRLGLLAPGGDWLAPVTAALVDPARLRRARVHPISVLIAMRTYAAGRGLRAGGGAPGATWEPVAAVVDALDAAFYAAYGAVEPTGRRTLLALDVSGSMGSSVSGLPLTAREASTALALVTAAVEPVGATQIVGFTGAGATYRMVDGAGVLSGLAISPRQRLDDALRVTAGLPFGPTDCALPMQWALREGRAVDTFVVYTDNETWHGSEHPHQALRRYREATGIPARLVVVGMTATRFTIADPSDAGMLDVAGFDVSVPQVVADFSRG